ncbi:MAG: hypothetical protein ACXAC7_20045 [Candidatus Hodarchaeales archaeon]
MLFYSSIKLKNKEEVTITQKLIQNKRIGNLTFVIRMHSSLWILIFFFDFLFNQFYSVLTEKPDSSYFTTPFDPLGRLLRFLVPICLAFIHQRIITYYGINLQRNELTEEIKSKPRFEVLFTSETAYHRFQQYSYNVMTDIRVSILAIVLSIGLFGLLDLSMDIERASIDLIQISILDLIYILFYSVYEIFYWIGALSGTFLLIQLTRTIRSIGDQDLSDLNIYEFENFDFSQPITFENRYEIVKFNIKRFKRQAKVVASFTTPFAILTVLFALFANITLVLNILFTNLEGGEIITEGIILSLVLTLGINLILMAASFILFFYPQYTLRNIINERKEKTLHEFETFYELKLMQWVQILGKTDETDMNAKTRLEKEMKILSDKIDELSELSGWPFEFKQGFTVVGAAIFPIITFIFTVFISVYIRGILIDLGV